MARASFRELFFLSAPVALIALLGFYSSRRPSPPTAPALLPPHGPQWKFSTRTPTALEAFRGSDAIFTLEYIPPFRGGLAGAIPTPTRPAYNASGPSNWDMQAYLEVQTPMGKKPGKTGQAKARPRVEVTYHSVSHPDDHWHQVWDQASSNETTKSFAMRLRSVPSTHSLVFSCNTKPYPFATGVTPTDSPPPDGRWKVNRAAIKPFDFAHLPRAPLVSLVSAHITLNSPTKIEGDALFRLGGATMNQKTDVTCYFEEKSGISNGLGYGTGTKTNSNLLRTMRWTVFKNPVTRPGQPLPLVRLSGRISVENRWPLAFTFAPINSQTAQGGQKINFTAAPASLPK